MKSVLPSGRGLQPFRRAGLLVSMFLLAAFLPAQGTFWTLTSDYSGTEICGGETDISICFSGVDYFNGTASIAFTPGAFIVTDPGDFTQVSAGLYSTPVEAPFDLPFCLHLKGKRSNPSSALNISGVLNGLHNGDPYLASKITVLPVFATINGGSGTPLSSFYTGAGSPLLSPSQSPFHDQYVRISGHIIVDANYEFALNSEIVMEPDASILVSPGVTFTLGPRMVVTACSAPWNTIEVAPTATLRGNGSIFGYNTIEGGEEAIRIQPGGNVNVSGTQFIDNGTAIMALGNNGVTSTTHLSVIACDFRDSHKYFPISTGIHATDLPYTELPLIWTFLFVLGNSFEGMTTGVFSDHSLLFIDRVQFNNVDNAVASFNNSDIEIRGWGGSGCDYAMINRGNTAVYSVASDLAMYDVACDEIYNGVETFPLFLNETDIHDNCMRAAISCVNVGSAANSTGSIYGNRLLNPAGKSYLPGIAAIELNDVLNQASTNDWLITRNEISSEGEYAGIYAINFENAQIFNNLSIANTNDRPAVRIDGGYQNKIQCNPSIQGSTGVLFDGTAQSRIDCNTISGNNGIQILGNCEKSDLRGNELYGTYADLLFGDPNATYALTGVQKYHRNRFLGSQGSGYDAINYEPVPDLANLSQFIVKTAEHYPCPADDELMPLFSASSEDWFYDNQFEHGSCPFQCPNPCIIVPGAGGEGGGEEGGRALDNAVRDGAVAVGPYSDGLRWTTQKRLYRRLMDAGSVPPDFVAFTREKERESIGSFYAFDAQLDHLLRWNEAGNTAIRQLRSRRAEKVAELRQVQPVSVQNGDLRTDPARREQYENLLAEVRRISAGIDQVKKAKLEEIQAALPVLRAENDRIVTAAVYEANQQAVNGLLLQRLADTRYRWSETDKNTLLGIATQCPLSGGDAVFQARALLAGEKGLPRWDDVAACPDSRDRSFAEKRADDASGISVFPNPADDWVNIYVDGNNPEFPQGAVTADLLGLEGRVLRSYRFADNQSLMHLALPALPAGMYMLRIARPGETPDTFKLFISQR